MTTVSPTPLIDDASRLSALTVHDRPFLVEAGAGSGKTAIMAGRIALMLAAGIAPRSIAAVTFTELAASELALRVREIVENLHSGSIPVELRIALPQGLSPDQRQYLAAATSTLDELTCSTIHGFCQSLIKPYPVEADIDPGATVMDRSEANLVFQEVIDRWLHETLSDDRQELLAASVSRDPGATVELVRTVADLLHEYRELTVDEPQSLAPLVQELRDAVSEFQLMISSSRAVEPETATIASQFADLAVDLPKSADTSYADLAHLLLARPSPELCRNDGAFLSYRYKTKWTAAARAAGLSRADGDELNTRAQAHYAHCCQAWTTLHQAAAAKALAGMVRTVKTVLDRYTAYKRSAALLDFSDLIVATAKLLRDHDPVRQALARRFAFVLVDEFQDTDPLQTEIFWRLCGDPPESGLTSDWRAFRIRPGALFLVGDPKQAIYRFRGADVAAYIEARQTLIAQLPDGILSITTNFRSREPILLYVNARFTQGLSTANGQPGFTALDAFHSKRESGPSVLALEINVPDDEDAAVEQQRDAEANTVAELCSRLIGREAVRDRESGEVRPCRAGDLALLAPTGTDLWRYEEALERRGIPVSTQAGKGLFRRQEIQDLIALTRVLADARETLALGALLRGPLIGLTEEELLDILWALPRGLEDPEALPKLTIHTVPESIPHPYARDLLQKLQSLRRSIHSTTPYNLLSRAVDVLRVRPILLERHGRQAERALANVDLYLSQSRAYDVRGLRAFAEAMTTAWTDEARAPEGSPDAQEEAVTLYTIHAAKGLEWPIVIPINTMTQLKSADRAVVDRRTSRLYCPVLGVEPTGYDTARETEKAELNRERVRLWYVAATRACEILILPRFQRATKRPCWQGIIDLGLAQLPTVDFSQLPDGQPSDSSEPSNTQTPQRFAAEASRIAAATHKLIWHAPSRDEGSAALSALPDEKISAFTADLESPIPQPLEEPVHGGRARGLILHKLIEEVLTGETVEADSALIERAETLISEMGFPAETDASKGPVAAEIASCVRRALSLPEVAELRPALLPEFPLYSSTTHDGQEHATGGIADAVAYTPGGKPGVVIDWKSDVAPNSKTLDHYRSQLEDYLTVSGAERGLIVLATSGTVIPIVRRARDESTHR